MNYRLGILGFLNHHDLPSANAGLLDQRMAMLWVKENIAKFGGDPESITIMGQSGGGWAILAQIGLYDGNTNGLFQRAIARSSQREPMFNTEELKIRNAALAKQLDCTGQDQLACFRNTSVPALVDVFQTFSTVKGSERFVLRLFLPSASISC
jgi:carboxylesterase type B